MQLLSIVKTCVGDNSERCGEALRTKDWEGRVDILFRSFVNKSKGDAEYSNSNLKKFP